MYTYSDVVELGRAQDVIMGGKTFGELDDATNFSVPPADEFDE